MFGRERYDLRKKELPWNFRDSYVGATQTDEQDVARTKRRMAWGLFGLAGELLLFCACMWAVTG